jgi:hypothetical protein
VSVTTLYRPVGPQEACWSCLIESAQWRAFPPRLPDQPIFYPVTTLEYANVISRDWNVKSHGAGYVLRFDVATAFLSEFEVQRVGSAEHEEYWIPAERLEEFNQAIVGPIVLVGEFHAT